MLGGATAWPLAVRAQQSRQVHRLCILAPDSRSSPWAARFVPFIEGLGALGYAVGSDIVIEFMSVDGKPERFPALAEECVRLKPDIIVAFTTPGGLAAKKATRTI